MYDVVVYLSSLPRIADRNRKTEVLQACVQGCQALGLKTLAQTANTVVPGRLAVILGWVGAKIKGPHIQLRKAVIDAQRASGGHVMAIDGSCFKFADSQNQFLRYSLDGVYYGRSNYANHNSGSDHWDQIRHALNLDLMPWRNSGEHILVCLQRDGGWSMKGVDMRVWAVETVRAIKMHSYRPIRIRPHPKFPVDLGEFAGDQSVTVSDRHSTLDQDLNNAWASVFFNSSSCVASVLKGIPVFATDDDCVAWAVANHDLSMIEQPVMPERNQWLWDLSAAHWTDDQSRQGHIIEKFQHCF